MEVDNAAAQSSPAKSESERNWKQWLSLGVGVASGLAFLFGLSKSQEPVLFFWTTLGGVVAGTAGSWWLTERSGRAWRWFHVVGGTIGAMLLIYTLWFFTQAEGPDAPTLLTVILTGGVFGTGGGVISALLIYGYSGKAH